MRIPAWIFLFLFTVSGFAGLIYESIWSHYLKLFLGHAAYAQTLVLGIFMGGMALGSWLAGRYANRIKQALLFYAIAELIIGFLALGFHAVFGAVTAWSFDVLIPALGSPFAIDLAKWAIASILILPASILLGTTFPLMSTGIMRAYEDRSGKFLPLLYFTNSFGAAVGVLASGFVLLDRFGLPGTIFTAGLFNIGLALIVWGLSKKVPQDVGGGAQQSPEFRSSGVGASPVRIMLLVAFVTGCASFMFEIAWIRMLSMAIGASTHSFEVMLSAFILGIALGGLVLGTIGARFKNYPRLLAAVLVAKALFAIAAVWIYPNLLDLVKWLYGGLARTESGYSLFLLGSYAVSGLMMIPTAFFAGMTLPLVTRALLNDGAGERVIGQVYAANTLGAIAGTFLATHVGMELLGVQGITAAGACIELVMAFAVLMLVCRIEPRRIGFMLAPALVLVLSFAFLFELDKLKMASGVYRFGHFMSDKTKVEFHKDGKTATISVLRTEQALDIRTNGKTDAGIRMVNRDRTSTPDEHTMELAAILPFLYVPDAKVVANIGFGSGLTTHTVLGNPSVQRVDSVEIEAAMIEGARLFLPINERAYKDPRSQIHIDDAKTYFSAQNRKYDIIISEPSNPWISGVSTLFSSEFYARIRNHINKGGVLVQWIQLYDTKPFVLASILKALGDNFTDYTIYFAGPGDAMIIASPHTKLQAQRADPFVIPNWSASLKRLGYSRLSELDLLRIGSRAALEPLVRSFAIRPNSDYFPVVDLIAPRERFIGASAIADFNTLSTSFVPLIAAIDDVNLPTLAELAQARQEQEPGSIPVTLTRALLARDVSRVLKGQGGLQPTMPESVRENLVVLQMGQKVCRPEYLETWAGALDVTLRIMASGVNAKDNLQTFQAIKPSECYKLAQSIPAFRLKLELLEAVVGRSMEPMLQTSMQLLELHEQSPLLTGDGLEMVIQAALVSSVLLGRDDVAQRVVEKFRADPVLTRSILTVAVLAHVERRRQRS